MPERKTKRPIFRIFIITALLLTVTFFAGRYILFRQIRNELRDRVLNLQKDGIALAFDSLYLNPWNGSISVQNLDITIRRDSSLYIIKASIPALVIRGIRIMPFIVDHSLAIHKIALTNPRITYRTSANLPDSKSRRAFLEGINIDDIRIDRAALIVMDSHEPRFPEHGFFRSECASSRS